MMTLTTDREYVHVTLKNMPKVGDTVLFGRFRVRFGRGTVAAVTQDKRGVRMITLDDGSVWPSNRIQMYANEAAWNLARTRA